MDKNIVHEIKNYLQQVISNAEYINGNDKMLVYSEKIKSAAYKIDALITDSEAEKEDINIDKRKLNKFDLSNFADMKILVVDDVIENINIMENIFNTLSCDVTSAMSGEEALEIFKNGARPEIICMDMMMPGIDGLQTTEELKLLGCEAYFIAISALKNQPSDVVNTFNCWLPKPFTTEHIMGALSNYKLSDDTTFSNDTQSYMLGDEIAKNIQDSLLHFAKKGAYSELLRLVTTLDESESKIFLNNCIKKVDFNTIIKSIVPS